MKMTLKKTGFALAALFAAVVMPEVALAQASDLGGILDTLVDQLQAALPFITILSYVVGGFFALTGLMRMKAAVESPQQGQMGPAIMRIVIGALLIALPWVVGTVLNTVGGEAGQSSGEFQVQ